MLNKADLSMFTGTEGYTRWSPLFRNHLLTDGAKYLAEEAGAYWLMDAIASHWTTVKKDADAREIAFWELKVTDNSAVLICRADSDKPPIVEQEISWTDFPFSIQLYCSAMGDGNMVIMLPGEY